MKKIEVDEDVYEFLLRNSVKIGESASEILRRLLCISSSENTPKKRSGISEFLNSPSFQAQRNATDKFLGILSYAYKKNPDQFDKVIQLKGRNRRYFALSSKELEDAGRSVFPKNISGSEYWVVTNNDTPKKRRILKDVLRILGYSQSTIEEATNHLV